MTAFLKDMLGDSWRTASIGVGLIFLGIVIASLGGVLTMWFATATFGAMLIAQGSILVPIGIGFLKTRDNAASVAAIKDIKSDHVSNQTKIEDLQSVVADVPADVRQAVKIEVAHKVPEIVEQVIEGTGDGRR